MGARLADPIVHERNSNPPCAKGNSRAKHRTRARGGAAVLIGATADDVFACVCGSDPH